MPDHHDIEWHRRMESEPEREQPMQDIVLDEFFWVDLTPFDGILDTDSIVIDGGLLVCLYIYAVEPVVLAVHVPPANRIQKS